MKIALIPPIPNLPMARLHGDAIHLLLAHLCTSQKYVDYYRHRSQQGDYIILDNSAHEFGTGVPMEDVLRAGKRVGAHEVVVPDVLFDARSTLDSARSCLRWLTSTQGWLRYEEAGRPRLMLVPQGQTQQELSACLRGLLQEWERFVSVAPGLVPPPVIGVSKDYQAIGTGLLPFVTGPLKAYRGNGIYDVHILGWASELWCLADIARLAPWVRSTDSAKPFVYASAGIRLEPGGRVPQYPKRTPTYFEDELSEAGRAIAARNCEVFRAAATDELIAPE